ncbi:hypothetical protein CDD83_4745 [Cordyceps sp. RAO-2017]|nr:hypothetical protein CDD83_4745 [Cordyceps sp. RAO-2017]
MRGGRQQNAGALNDEVAANVIIEFPGPEFFPSNLNPNDNDNVSTHHDVNPDNGRPDATPGDDSRTDATWELEQNVDAAETAQTALRSFFSKAQSNGTPSGAQGQVTLQEAANVSLGGPNRVNLVDFTVDVGRGPVGKKNS